MAAINQNQAISKNLFDLLNQKVVKVHKKSTLIELKENDLKELKDLEIILGVYRVYTDNNDAFLVYKIFVNSDLMIKGSYKEYNIISNALLNKNKDKENISNKVNIYSNQDNQKLQNTIIYFVKNKLNEEELKPGEYILQGFKLIDLLEIEI